MSAPDRKRLLPADELAAALAAIPEWEHRDTMLVRELRFADFVAAFGFMTRVALVAERLNHHPDWSNSWNRVTVAITNHDAGGLTEIDVELARRIDALV